MPSKSEFLEKAKEEANIASDEHCRQWELLQKIAEPTIDDLAHWLSSRDLFYKAQEKFENMVRQISSIE